MNININKGLTLVGSRPNSGKTNLVIDIINNMIDKKILFLDYESGKDYLGKKITNKDVSILDNKSNYIEDIIDICSNENIDVIVIDYLQLIDSKNINGIKKQRYIIKLLKELSKEKNLSIILLSQLIREDNKIPNKDTLVKGLIPIEDIDTFILIYVKDNKRYISIDKDNNHIVQVYLSSEKWSTR